MDNTLANAHTIDNVCQGDNNYAIQRNCLLRQMFSMIQQQVAVQ